jgi:DNA topoisomerase-3
MTGSWEKQLKILKRNFYRCSVYQQHMKQWVDALVYEVRSETTRANISGSDKKSKREKKVTGIALEFVRNAKGDAYKGNQL